MKSKATILIPLLFIFLGDILVHYFKENTPIVGTFSLYVYPTYLLNSIVTYYFVKNEKQYQRIAGMVVYNSVSFFILTNFFVFLEGEVYGIYVLIY